MASRDYGFLTLRNTTAYQSNGLPVPPNRIFITSTNGTAIFSDTVTLSSINTSSISVSSINTSSINTNSLTANSTTINFLTVNSTINASTINATNISTDFLSTFEHISFIDHNLSTVVVDVIGSTLYVNGAPIITQGNISSLFWKAGNYSSIFNINTGNVGIGTSTPQTKLDVYGTGRFSSTLFIDGGISTTGASTLIIQPAVQFNTMISSVSISSILPDSGDYSLRLFGNVFFYSTLNAPPGSTIIVYASTSFNRPVVFNNSITVNQGNTLYIDAPTTFNEDVYFNSTINAPLGSTLTIVPSTNIGGAVKIGANTFPN